MKKRKQPLSLSYRELQSMGLQKLEKLISSGTLTEDTVARVQHLGRFYLRVGQLMPNPALMVGDVFNEDELQKIWRESADPEAGPNIAPLVH